jgi:hypothetical protein
VLSRHTRTPGRCWFAVWEGWAGQKPARHPDLITADRRYYLRSGPIEALLSEQDPPSLWWPEDRSWCVATEIDLDSTYLGTSWPCLRELLAQTDIECLVAEPDDRIGYDADPENPVAPDHR